MFTQVWSRFAHGSCFLPLGQVWHDDCDAGAGHWQAAAVDQSQLPRQQLPLGCRDELRQGCRVNVLLAGFPLLLRSIRVVL